MRELLALPDSVNEDGNDVTASDVIAVCQPVEQRKALLGLPRLLGIGSRKERMPKCWRISLSVYFCLSFHIFKFYCVSLCMEGNILICSADFICLLPPGMEAVCQCVQDIQEFGSVLQIFDAI